MLQKDPLNLLIVGVGGQGNLLASRLIGSCLVEKGFKVTIGETLGVSQRGGSVNSFIRISEEKNYSPQFPFGGADIVLGLEPVESLRNMGKYGNPDTVAVVNKHPVYPIGVLSGELEFPEIEMLESVLRELTGKILFIEATEKAMELGSPIFANMILMGGVIGLNKLPVSIDDLYSTLAKITKGANLSKNLEGFRYGEEEIHRQLKCCSTD